MEEQAISMDGSHGSLEEFSLPHEKKGDTVISMGWDRKLRALFVVSDCLRPSLRMRSADAWSRERGDCRQRR